MKDWSVGQAMTRFRKVSTELACIDSKSPTIMDVERAFGPDVVQAYIESWIVNLRLFFNVGKGMNDTQTMETAMLIVDAFPHLNIADINLVCKRAKQGYYGQIYDRLDGNVIIGWFNRYFDDRCERAAERSQREAEQFNMNIKDTPERIEKEIRNILKLEKHGK